jgi:hypothetical protein
MRLFKGASALFSSLFLLAIYYYCFFLFHKYDWGQPFVKLLCFSVLLAVTIILSFSRPCSQDDILPARREAGVLLLVLAAGICQYAHYVTWVPRANHTDIAVSVERAVEGFYRDFSNPYMRKDINASADYAPYNGLQYGPGMLVGYAVTVLAGSTAYKISSLVFLAMALLLACLLSWQKDVSPGRNSVTCLFMALAFLMPERMWQELLAQGANDIFPAFLVLLALYGIRRRSFFWAGAAAGLAVSAKLMPVLFILLCARRTTPAGFFKGVLAGLFPVFFFFLWDPRSLIGHCLVFQFVKSPDSTSLYSIAPPEIHWVFAAVPAMVLLFFMIRNFRRPLDHRPLAVHFLVLALVSEAFYRHVHCNHLVFIIPFVALVMGWYRHGFLSRLRSLFDNKVNTE